MSKKLYVGGLATTIDSNGLEKIFREIGLVISAQVVTDHGQSRSKGYGFVEMATVTAALEAIARLNATEHEGRTIIVNEIKTYEARHVYSF